MRRSRKILVAGIVLPLLVAGVAAAYAWYRLTQPFVSAAATAAPAAQTASAARLEQLVRKLSTDFSNRTFDNGARLEGAAAYLESQLARLGFKVESQRFTAEGRPYRNLVVKLGPDTADVTVVGAHYDVAGEQPGADDNASGVAGLLELARLLKGQSFRQRVELVFYTNEEPPFFRTPHMGSAIHARSLAESGKRASLMLSLECIGYFSDEPGSQEHPVRLLNAIYPTTGNFISLVGFYQDGDVARQVKAAMKSASDLPVYSINAPGFVVGVDFSDHLNYWHEGYVGMMVTDTAFYRNKAYHTPQDTADRLDYGRMAKVVEGVRAVVMQHAGPAVATR
ncbi:M28 family peptidase [Polaromonas sp. JS666]|uniref:M28 family peptidase n=1 Tax=Polaromonas sp. (strain JS666 / ATCC BAA-500) TaxID=296591 RepID=UPI0008883777|nr:M28 family peptidase [Polaromonas sp. JS666]SDM85579.1 Zn-dependent amino-or carboxypeptidase, M28 family [Polaromonas sp. JS666]